MVLKASEREAEIDVAEVRAANLYLSEVDL